MMLDAILVTVMLAAGGWGLWIISTEGLESGRTACYQTYLLARRWPCVSWLMGALSLYAAQSASQEVALAWWLVQGHMLFPMRDVTR